MQDARRGWDEHALSQTLFEAAKKLRWRVTDFISHKNLLQRL